MSRKPRGSASNPAETAPVSSGGPSLADAVKAVWSEPVAVGLALVIFFRPWRDGVTYPSFNLYFLFVILVLASLWGVRLLTRGGAMRHGVPTFLLAGFFLVMVLTALGTVQVDATYRALLYWATCGFVFLLTVNAVRTPLAIGLVLGAFVVTAVPNAIWSILHYSYVLPMMRQMVGAEPHLLHDLGFPEMSPELIHRLESNRAFGTFLFPNALAGFLILLIPYALGEFWPSIQSWRETLANTERTTGKPAQERLYTSTAVGLLLWFPSAALAWFLYPYLLLIIANDSDWFARVPSAVFYMGILPMAIGALGLVITRLYGLTVLRLTLQCLFLAALIGAASIALWLTVSRGGMLALAVSLVFCGALLVLSRAPRLPRWIRPVTVGLIIAGALLVHGVSQAQQDPPPSPAPPESGVGSLRVEGREVEFREFIDPSTFRLRLTYWNVGWAMARDNFWTGVGLGNFGTVYANYQHLGAGDTQTAHNDYLQLLAETGIFGVLIFCAFWAYFLLWGARRILAESDTRRRLALTGMYGGVLAFLAHAFVDFNFVNPSLTLCVFAMAGLFYARAHPAEDVPVDDTPRQASRAAAVPLLLVAALVMGAAVRVWIFDAAITEGPIYQKLINPGNRIVLRNRGEVIRDFLTGMDRPPAPGQPIVRPITRVGLLIPNPAVIETFGLMRVPVGGTQSRQLRALQPGEIPPPDTLVFITDLPKAREAAAAMTEAWIESLALKDSLYPHVPEIATVLYEWHDLLQTHTEDPEQRTEYVLAAEKWAQAVVDRSPRQGWNYLYLGKAHILRGTHETGMTAVEYYRRAVEQYEKARDLYPISWRMWQQYALAQGKVGQALKDGGLTEEGDRRIADAEAAQRRAEELRLMRPQG